jgi:hypothetical protein
MDGENLSALDPGNRLVDAKTQLHSRSRPRINPIGRRSLGRHSLGRCGEHRASEDHPGPARKLFPLRTKDALGESLIRLLSSYKARQKGESNGQPAS